jgi:anti-anti-sigma regulatory factor
MTAAEGVSIGRTRKGIVVCVRGRGTARESPTVGQLITDALQQQPESVAVDLTQCTYLDSTFLGCLVTLQRKSESLPGDPFVIAACPETRVQLFQTRQLASFLHTVDDAPEPIGELVDIAIADTARHDFGRHVADTHRALASLGGEEAGKFEQIADHIERELNGS